MPIYIVWPIYCFCKTRTVAIRHHSGVLWGRKSAFFQGKHNEEVSNRTNVRVNACMWKMLRSMDQHLVRTTAKHHIPIIFTPALASHMAPPEQQNITSEPWWQWTDLMKSIQQIMPAESDKWMRAGCKVWYIMFQMICFSKLGSDNLVRLLMI